MKVTVSTAVSADGYLDDRSPDRLILSTPEDWAEVHRLRAACDAIPVSYTHLTLPTSDLV